MEKEKIIELNNKIKQSGKGVFKRNGRKVDFEGEKIAIAIKKAFESIKDINYTAEDINAVYVKVLEEILKIEKETVKVEEIQDIIENILEELKYINVKESFSDYREKRAISRAMYNEKRKKHKFSSAFNTSMTREMLEENSENILNKLPDNIFKDLGKNISEKYATSYILKRKITEGVESGEIYIKDIEYIPMGTTEGVMLNLDKIMEEGFSTGIGKYRKPKSIRSYSALTYTLIDRLKKEQSGSSGIPYFDKYFAKIFVEDFKCKLLNYINLFLEFTDYKKFVALNSINMYINKLESIKVDLDEFRPLVRNSDKVMEIISISYIKALLDSEKELYKGIEALIHNLNNNILDEEKEKKVNIGLNIGSDKSLEGLMVSKILLDIIKKGIGNNISPIEPDIFILIDEKDLAENYAEFTECGFLEKVNEIEGINEQIQEIKDILECINYKDIIRYSIDISKTRDNISYVFNNKTKEDEGIKYLMGDMSIPENIVDTKKNSPEGRGILSTTSINLPRIAIKTKNKKEFYNELDQVLKLVFLQLFDRFNIQCDFNPKYFSTLYFEPVWLESEKIKEGDRLRKILKHGSMNLGITGLYDAVEILIIKEQIKTKTKENLKNKEKPNTQEENFNNKLKLSEDILKYIEKRIAEFTKEKNINLNIYADENAASYFTKMDKALYGITSKERYEKGTTYRFNKLVKKEDIENENSEFNRKLFYEGKMQKYTKGGNLTKIYVDDSINLKDYINILKLANNNKIKHIKILKIHK